MHAIFKRLCHCEVLRSKAVAIFPFKLNPKTTPSLRALQTQGVAISTFKLKPLIFGLLKHLGG